MIRKLILFLTMVSLFTSGLPLVHAQPLEKTVVTRVKPTITVNNKIFKDLNANGVLDDYENWDLPIEERVASLLSQMTLEEKVSLMLITEYPQVEDGRIVLPNESLNRGQRYFIFRGNQSADVIAHLNNQLQEAAEASRLGIPAVIISNPRNHESTIANIREDGQFSHWPDPLGLAAMRDLDLIKTFAETAAKEWRAAGIHKMYGYSADIATDPLWPRIVETFGEDPQLVSDIIYTLVKGFEGDVLDENSVSMTTRHFPGGGAREKGTDSHFEEGAYNVWPTRGSLLKYHIPPFKAAIDAYSTSIMPYYAAPSNRSADQGLSPFAEGQQFEEVAFTMNEQFIRYLREELGFLGYINSDTSAVIDRAWGAMDLSLEERFAKAINAGTNIFSGATNPEPIINAVEQGLVSEEKIERSVTYLLTEMMKLGLFENPYVDPDYALEVANNASSQEQADLAHRKAIVLLRNETRLLPMTDDTLPDVRLYVERFPGGENGELTNALRELIRTYDPDIPLTDSLEEATHAFVWVLPRQDLLKRQPTVTIGPITGIENVERIVEIQRTVPTITAIDFSSPWLINEIEPEAGAVIATFGVKVEGLIDVIRGRYNPTGKLPFTIPASQEAVNNEKGDVPGFDEDAGYPYEAKSGDRYVYNFGLSYVNRGYGSFFRNIGDYFKKFIKNDGK